MTSEWGQQKETPHFFLLALMGRDYGANAPYERPTQKPRKVDTKAKDDVTQNRKGNRGAPAKGGADIGRDPGRHICADRYEVMKKQNTTAQNRFCASGSLKKQDNACRTKTLYDHAFLKKYQ